MSQPVINSKTRKSFTKIGILIAILSSKLKLILPLLKAAKFLSFISMIFFLFTYGMTFGWYFAFAIFYLLVCHEGGHLIAAKRKGLPTSPAFFIPFVGAVITMKELPKDAVTESYVAFGGPFIGFLSILPAIPLYLYTHNEFFGLVIALGCILNLFNMIPVSPLDGGRILSALPPVFWIFGIIMLCGFAFYKPSFIVFYIILIGIITIIQRMREPFQLKVIERKIKLYEHTIKQFQFNLFNMYHVENIYKRRFIPYIQDKKKIEHLVLLEQKEVNKIIRSIDYGIQETDEEWYQYIDNKIEMIRIEKILPLLKEKEKIETYYVTKKSTKWKIFIAYILLTSALSILGFWGYSLIETVIM